MEDSLKIKQCAEKLTELTSTQDTQDTHLIATRECFGMLLEDEALVDELIKRNILVDQSHNGFPGLYGRNRLTNW